jgi:hypothetical protein
MGLFKNLISASLETMKPVPTVPIPPELPRIAAPTAAEIAKSCPPGPEAQKLAVPGQTPAQFLGALQEHHMGDEMVKMIAHGLPDKEGVGWATQSAKDVGDKLPPAEIAAQQAAEAWVKHPSPETKAAAQKAAGKSGLKGPGGWAAQAAAWSQAAPPGPQVAPKPKMPRLTPQAVSAAVLLAAAISANPEVAPKAEGAPTAAPAPEPPSDSGPAAEAGPPLEIPAKVRRFTYRSQQPFIAKGVDIASGKTPV